MLETRTLPVLEDALVILNKGFANLPPFTQAIDTEILQDVLQTCAEHMQNNYPYHHPLYIGQMLKPPHPVARLAYALSLWMNPNNHALDGGRASSAMEKEAVAQIAAMFGWQQHLGHLTSGGTMANMEALWIAREETAGKTILASQQAHYTHERVCKVLCAPFQSVPNDGFGRMDLDALKHLLDTIEVGTVVVTLGTTATGSVDNLPAILELRERYGFRVHVDTAYGGYFTLVDNLDAPARAAFDALSQVDSIAIDPHKHGLQPYGCGCILFADPAVGRHYRHDSGYTYFTSEELHLGEISLECSRAGASAVALWTTMQLLPLQPAGEFAQTLRKSRQAALEFYSRLQGDQRFRVAFAPELDIVIWTPQGQRASDISNESQRLFDRAAANDLHMALANLPRTLLESHWPDIEWDTDSITCLRACLMKPEHLDWMDVIWERLVQSLKA